IPLAKPDTMANPASPSWRASRPAILAPTADALREPTIATIGRPSSRALPRTERSGGARAGARGYSGSRKATRLPPNNAGAASSPSASSRGGMRGALESAAAGKRRNRPQRGAGAAAKVEQRAERARADIVAADEAEPIDPLLIREMRLRRGLARRRCVRRYGPVDHARACNIPTSKAGRHAI